MSEYLTARLFYCVPDSPALINHNIIMLDWIYPGNTLWPDRWKWDSHDSSCQDSTMVTEVSLFVAGAKNVKVSDICCESRTGLFYLLRNGSRNCSSFVHPSSNTWEQQRMEKFWAVVTIFFPIWRVFISSKTSTWRASANIEFGAPGKDPIKTGGSKDIWWQWVVHVLWVKHITFVNELSMATFSCFLCWRE